MGTNLLKRGGCFYTHPLWVKRYSPKLGDKIPCEIGRFIPTKFMVNKDFSFEYIRSYYKVPAYKGQRVKELSPLKARYGTITKAEGPYVLIRWDGTKNALPYHPESIEWPVFVSDLPKPVFVNGTTPLYSARDLQ